ncbi:hypothetical protein J422_01925 [Methanocaldococcus villosus KIN24-T80]|uniref:Uncharacterized protein n=1 Tax=Methanocaldococcus villosus KIN24-T80 TaxID=1069083 RepID=N6VZJ9_9EURY|nr:hypothetical protein [Methanocaldococcus villosus]ENN96532.1 hypothetical protein J422_01925 [Methanocaldococcus villosus KIN24-T80]
MIFDYDLIIATIILIVGLGMWSVSLVEHNNVYLDAVKNEYKIDKGLSTMETLIKSGVLQDFVILYSFNDTEIKRKAIMLLNNSIPLDSYRLEINNETIIEKNFNSSNTYIIATLILNRSEGWYIIYGNDTYIDILDKRFPDYMIAKEYAEKQLNYPILMPVYYSKNISSVIVKLYIK